MRFYLPLAVIFGLTAVIMGAVGSHLMLTYPVQQQAAFDIAVRYQMWHGLLLLALSFVCCWQKNIPYSKFLNTISFAFVLGIILFSGGIFIKIFITPTVGMLIPIGGGVLILAWVLLLIYTLLLIRAR